MEMQEQINKYIASEPESKRNDMQELHQLMLHVLPGCRLGNISLVKLGYNQI